MTEELPIGPEGAQGLWREEPGHRAWLMAEADRQIGFFRAALREDGGFDTLDWAGRPRPTAPQAIHDTTRMVHSYVMARFFGAADTDPIIDAGMDFLWTRHRDTRHGGYAWSVGRGERGDDTKLAYGHVFVLLAASSAKMAGHPDADRLLADVAEVLETHFWDDAHGLLRDEFTRDWRPFSTYRGMNANMHGVEGMLAAFEATGEALWLERAGRILDFFVGEMAPAHGWRLPEHYTEDWAVDPDYSGNPMFRPAGTTPGHSLEFGRLVLQHWDLTGRADPEAPTRARRLVDQALADAWLPEGGLAYTLDRDGKVAIPDRYWWPVTEAIGAVAALLKVAPDAALEGWYRRLWYFAEDHLIDTERGGWYPELGPDGDPVDGQFPGKPDIYHALQGTLFPLVAELSRQVPALARLRA